MAEVPRDKPGKDERRLSDDVVRQPSQPDEVLSDGFVERLLPPYDFVRRYHRYEVKGLENIPRHGSALVVFTHSLATYDILLFGAAVYFERQRLIRALADRLVMKTPLLSAFARSVRATVGEPQAAARLLREGHLVGVAPGGMREALRSFRHRYRIDWRRRYGFSRLAIATQAPVILAACPAADDLYTVIDNPLTRSFYERLRVPVPLAFGRLLTPLPRPVRLVHYVGEPIVPPKPPASESVVARFHAHLCSQMGELIRLGCEQDKAAASVVA